MTEEDKFIIDTFTWSFSRLESFYQCPYAWKRTYIDCEDKTSNAFAEYGSCCHRLLQDYEEGNVDIFDISEEFDRRFLEEIPSDFPANKYTDLRESYYLKGKKYFEEINLPLDDITILGIEEEVHFKLGGKPFIGFVDLRYRDADGKMVFLDHKSANIKIRKDGKVSKSDADKMRKYEYQQYLYTIPFIEAGETVDFLAWNFFNNQQMYVIPWDRKTYEEARKWALDTIALIEAEEDFAPNPQWYVCYNICDHRDWCEYKP